MIVFTHPRLTGESVAGSRNEVEMIDQKTVSQSQASHLPN